MANLKYIEGDATKPQAEGQKIIFHICNNIGAWGAGFVIAVSKKYPSARIAYKALSFNKSLTLGYTQFVHVDEDVIIANMIAQDGINDGRNGWMGDLIDYESLDKCLEEVFKYAKDNGASLHAPKIGSGLAGGDWPTIERLLMGKVGNYGVDCTVYTLPAKGV